MMKIGTSLGLAVVMLSWAWSATPASAAGPLLAPEGANYVDPDDALENDIVGLDALKRAASQPSTTSERRSGPSTGTSPMMVSEEVPDRYVIQNGDTLWDISGRFWGDSFFWPTLWSYNPYIGNAHFIYPGNVLSFSSGNYVRPPSMGFEDQGGEPVAEEAPEPEIEELEEMVQPVVENARSARACSPPIPFHGRSQPVSVRTDGFLRERGFGPVGKIAKAPDAKILLSSRDIVYVQFSRVEDIQCGDEFTIYEPTHKRVSHPIYKRRVIGDLYRILGQLQIVDVNDFTATGEITAAYGEIYRGALLTPRVNALHTVIPVANSREVEGFIVQALNQESTTLGTNDVVYLDRGEEDGVGPGDVFFVVRQGDGLQGMVKKGKRDITLPYQIVGKVVVIEPGEFISEAIITESSEVLEVGDHITTQVN